MTAVSKRLALCVGLLVAGAASAQAQPGDADFCRRYAAAAGGAAEDAIAVNPSCLDPGKGVHPNRQAHAEWCARTPSEKVEGAATHIVRLASRCTQGALAAPTDYGGFDVAGANQTFEKPYGTARDWQVLSASSGSTFLYCVAVSKRDGREVRIGLDSTVLGAAGQWQVAVPVQSRKDWAGTFEVDGKGLGNGGGSQIGGTALPGWTIAWLSAGEVDGMRKGRMAVLGAGKQDYDFSLEGAAAALLKVEECSARKGLGASAMAMPAPAHTAAAAGRPGGDMITPDLAGASQSCIGPRDGRWEAGAKLVLKTCRAATDKGFGRAGGSVTAANGALCIAPGGADAALTLEGCGAAPAWTWSGTTAQSAPIRSADGRCWAIPAADDPSAVFPFPVIAAPCATGAKPPLGFFLSKD